MKKEIEEKYHGTATGYNYKCRCVDCKKAHADANRDFNRANSHKYKPEPSDSTILAISIASEPYWMFNGHGFNPIINPRYKTPLTR